MGCRSANLDRNASAASSKAPAAPTPNTAAPSAIPLAIALSILPFAIAASVPLPGCTKPNPRYCDEHEDCPDNHFCDMGQHRCIPSECGNGTLERGEVCDGAELGSHTCWSASGHLHGSLLCTQECQLDVSGCHTCGNGLIEGPEPCDGTDLAGQTCQDQGYEAGQLACSQTCAFDLRGCTTCGNAIMETGEECDSTDFGTQTCQTASGHPHGSLSCTQECQLDVSACHTCGNSTIEGPEDCEQGNLGGATCVSTGHSGGVLTCAADCTFDTGDCYDCGDGTCDLAKGENHVSCELDCGWATISAGMTHTCATKRDGTAWCWGNNNTVQLGDNATHQNCGLSDCSPAPVQVSGVMDATDVKAGGGHSCSLLGNGTVWCWGANQFGQLGDGATHQDCDGIDCSPTPVQVLGLTSVQSLATGVGHACSVLSDGTAWCWGSNSLGQLGDGTTIDRITPVQVSNLSDVISVSTNRSSSCAVKSDNTASCWGENYGQTPQPVSGLADVQIVSVGWLHTCTTKTDGTVWCWGANSFGQLGDGTTTDRPAPVQVTGLTDVSHVSSGALHSCASKANGTAWCWGSSHQGQLGDGTTHQDCAGEDCSPVPVQVLSLTNTLSVAAGGYEFFQFGDNGHTCTLTSAGAAWCWGADNYGQLGNGTTTDSSVPASVADPY